MKSSSDVVGAVLKELRLQAGGTEGGFRLAVAVDGVNGLWGRTTLKKEDKSPVLIHLYIHSPHCGSIKKVDFYCFHFCLCNFCVKIAYLTDLSLPCHFSLLSLLFLCLSSLPGGSRRVDIGS